MTNFAIRPRISPAVRWAVAATLALATASARPALAQAGDSARVPGHVFPRSDALILGGFAVAAVAMRPLDTRLTQELREPEWQHSKLLGRGSAAVRLLAVPGTLVGGGAFYLVGRARGDETMSGVALHGVESVVATNVVTYVVKGVAGRARPYMDERNSQDFQLFRGFGNRDYQSFPSGHTASAFAMAAALTSETAARHPHSRYVVGGVLYTLATLTGTSRIFDDKHWASDVVAGAAIGTLTGLTVVRYSHVHPDNYVDRKLTVAPGEGGYPIIFTIPIG
ncbi:MAG TPA: phosphatase PAP2 family protein [Longimicrobium sp.]